MSAVVAALCTTIAVALVLPPAPSTRWGRGGTSGRRWAFVAAGALAAAALLAGSAHLLVVAIVAAGVAGGLARLVAGRRRERLAVASRSRVVELCDALQAELAAGQTAGLALERAAAEWPEIAPVARAAVAGGDVPTALRSLADRPGTGALRVVAAAWQVAHRTGHGLADTLGRVADDLRATEQTRRVVDGELSSARATARLLAALPLLALAMGSGAGAHPWRFLFGHPIGLACLAAGLALAYAGLAWIDALARDIERAT
ncbi:type II secretion system F family protein [Nocardioides sp. WS12]|uniref:type II secretion system F family protein n=1 Tax=Nocardioides sp. WS12 TaxID=2486272 RepID=UPI0015FA9376|nr:type II secretion system F family protein [Nocardioides sp. WS12]